jgi:hypothetical protein
LIASRLGASALGSSKHNVSQPEALFLGLIRHAKVPGDEVVFSEVAF